MNTVEIRAQDLDRQGGVFCPNPLAGMNLVDNHPKVFLNVAREHSAQCPYCGTVYQLTPNNTPEKTPTFKDLEETADEQARLAVLARPKQHTKKLDFRIVVKGRTVAYVDSLPALDLKVRELGLQEGEYSVTEHVGWGAV